MPSPLRNTANFVPLVASAPQPYRPQPPTRPPGAQAATPNTDQTGTRARSSAAEVSALINRQQSNMAGAISGPVLAAKAATLGHSVCQLDHEDLMPAIEDLRDQMDELTKPPGVSEEDWNFRLAKTNELLDMIELALPGLDHDKDKILGYKTDDEVKGLLVLEHKSPPSVYAFVTLPDPSIRGAGRALMEHAQHVSESAMHGNGALQLTPLNVVAEKIYLHWGFAVDPSDPAGKRMTIAHSGLAKR